MREWMPPLVRYYLGYWRNALRSWWRRQRPVNPLRPGHSKLERLRALDDEMVFRKD